MSLYSLYNIHYPDRDIRQVKILIPHNEYLRISELEPDEYKRELKRITKGHEWFTDQSPYYQAITTNIIDCNGQYKCIVTPIK